METVPKLYLVINYEGFPKCSKQKYTCNKIGYKVIYSNIGEQKAIIVLYNNVWICEIFIFSPRS